jgi:hypothetical protein
MNQIKVIRPLPQLAANHVGLPQAAAAPGHDEAFSPILRHFRRRSMRAIVGTAPMARLISNRSLRRSSPRSQETPSREACAKRPKVGCWRTRTSGRSSRVKCEVERSIGAHQACLPRAVGQGVRSRCDQKRSRPITDFWGFVNHLTVSQARMVEVEGSNPGRATSIQALK